MTNTDECAFCGWQPGTGEHGCTPKGRAEAFFAEHPEPDEGDIRDVFAQATLAERVSMMQKWGQCTCGMAPDCGLHGRAEDLR